MLLGEPLVVHTIRVSLASRTIARTIVSTDSDEIAAVSRAAGAEVIERPAALATDEARTEAALLHVLEMLEQRGETVPQYTVTLEPTSPLRTAAMVDACVDAAVANGAGAVITVTETRDLFGRLDGDRFTYLEPGQRRRRQEREPLYREAGVAYVTRTDWLREHESVLGEPLHAVVVPEEHAVDINTPFDLIVAEAAMQALRDGRLDG